jgi:hypothetical protein
MSNSSQKKVLSYIDDMAGVSDGDDNEDDVEEGTRYQWLQHS